MFKQLWPVRYIIPAQIQEVKPDANVYYRFSTTFLTFLTDSQVQTSHGVILLNSEYSGPKLSHNDSIMVLGICAQKGRFEGTVRKVDPIASRRLQELCIRRSEVEGQEKQQAGRPQESVEIVLLDEHF